jgi:hypothetical protein
MGRTIERGGGRSERTHTIHVDEFGEFGLNKRGRLDVYPRGSVACSQTSNQRIVSPKDLSKR